MRNLRPCRMSLADGRVILARHPPALRGGKALPGTIYCSTTFPNKNSIATRGHGEPKDPSLRGYLARRTKHRTPHLDRRAPDVYGPAHSVPGTLEQTRAISLMRMDRKPGALSLLSRARDLHHTCLDVREASWQSGCLFRSAAQGRPAVC